MTHIGSIYSLSGKRVFVAGHRGMVGSAIVRRLSHEQCEILTVSRDDLDLRDQNAVRAWMADTRPEVVFLAAAKVGGIMANSMYPADFLFDNLAIQNAIIDASLCAGVEKLLFLGSSCIYPKYAPQPIPEEALLSGPLEPTNEWYAIAKIAGLKLCQAYRAQHGVDFISAMPTNLYGPGDNYHPENSHVMAATIRKVVNAKANGDSSIVVWGSGNPRREFLYVDDAADALVFLMEHYSATEHINVGCGVDVSILELAELVAKTVGYDGLIETDPSKPDGTPRKLLDVSRIFDLGWKPHHKLEDGVRYACRSFADGHS